MTPSKQQMPLGGMWINVYGLSELLASGKKEAVVLLFLHGRFGSAERIEHIVHKTYKDAGLLADEGTLPSLLLSPSPHSSSSHDNHAAEAKPNENGSTSSSSSNAGVDKQGQRNSVSAPGEFRGLLIVSFDQRNHGTRKISQKAQEAWAEGNPKHGQDMLAMQAGTAADCSFLADFLESFLFPNDEARITKWAVTGISLGGHAAWIVLKNDPRFTIGVPMLGCPSYRVLMRHRAALAGLPYSAPHMPASLLALLERIDPDSVPYTSRDWVNPYLGKRILVLHGDADELVPWHASAEFVDGLEVGPDGEKRVVLEKKRGHETSALMIAELTRWIVDYGMKCQS